MGEGICEKCETKIDLNYLLEIIDKKPFSEDSRAYCSQCEYPDQPTAVELNYDRWLCLFCLSEDDRAGHCEWCSEFVTGDTTDTYFSGCIFCEGRKGWDND